MSKYAEVSQCVEALKKYTGEAKYVYMSPQYYSEFQSEVPEVTPISETNTICGAKIFIEESLNNDPPCNFCVTNQLHNDEVSV